MQARYVVGADGMHSTVRELANVNLTAGTYPQSFVLADVRMSWALPGDEVMLFFAPAGLVVVAPLPGGRHRIVATVADAPEQISLADAQHLLDERGPAASVAQIHEILWASRFRVHHGVAERYRAGSVLLAGDAAHVHSPAGGQGMNTGIQDAHALAGMLAAVLAGDADESLLDNYERERRPVALDVVRFTDRLTRLATIRGKRSRALRNALIYMLGHIPAVRRALAMNLSQLRVRGATERTSSMRYRPA